MAELPKPDSVFSEEYNANAKSLYRLVYDAQSTATEEEDLVCSRIVGYLLLHPINLTARGVVMKELASIHSLHGAQSSSKIYELGKMYMDHLIRPFRKYKGRTPASSSHVSRPSFDRRREDVRTILKEYPTSHATAKKKALIRDGYRCLLNGSFDKTSLSKKPAVKNAVFSSWPKNEIRTITTECAHIFADATNSGITGNSEARQQKRDNAATFWAILEGFGYPKILQAINGQGIHRLENVMTLDSSLHDSFDKLELWLEAVDGIPYTYTVKTAYEPDLADTMNFPARVTFSYESALRIEPDLPAEPELSAYLPLPNPEYLHIHACVCKVAHMSGAAGYIDYIFRKMEDIGVLSEDGASADVLKGALSFFTNAPRSVALSA